MLLEQQGLEGVQIRDVAVDDIAPEDFAMPADPNVLPQGTRDADARTGGGGSAIEGFENGVSIGRLPRGADGKIYSLVIRPLLPDEDA